MRRFPGASTVRCWRTSKPAVKPAVQADRVARRTAERPQPRSTKLAGAKQPRPRIPAAMKGIALLKPSDQAAALAQRKCPVTGDLLGSEGKPLKVRVRGRTVFVCCRGLRPRTVSLTASNWKPPQAHVANSIGGLIMFRLSIIVPFVFGLAVAVGLSGCGSAKTKTPKTPNKTVGKDDHGKHDDDDHGKHGAKVDQAKIDANLAKLSEEDQKAARAQKTCPVMPKSLLGSMGMPVKVEANGQSAFLCCKGCQKKFTKDPDKYLAIINKAAPNKKE